MRTAEIISAGQPPARDIRYGQREACTRPGLQADSTVRRNATVTATIRSHDSEAMAFNPLKWQHGE